MTIGGVFSEIGKDLLKTAFPDAYSAATKYRRIANKIKSNSKSKKSKLDNAISELHHEVKETNEISTDILESILVQNDLLTKILNKKGGIGSGHGGGGLVDELENGLIEGAEIAAGAAAVKSVIKRTLLRDKKTGRFISKAAAAAAAEDAAKAGKEISVASKLLRGAGQLAKTAGKFIGRVGNVASGVIDAYEEYETSGNLAKAGTVGAGATIGGLAGGFAGAAIGQVLIPIPVLGALIGRTVGSFAGGWIGSKIGGLGYDYMNSSGNALMQADIINYKANDITLKATDIIISAQNIIGLKTQYDAGKSIPMFRPGIGGQALSERRHNAGSGNPQDGSTGSGNRGSGGGGDNSTWTPGQTGAGSYGKGANITPEKMIASGVNRELVESIVEGGKREFGDPNDPNTRYVVQMQGGIRDQKSGKHGQGKAVDLQIYDRKLGTFVGGDAKGDIMKNAFNNPNTFKIYDALHRSRYEYIKENYGEEEARRISGGTRFGSSIEGGGADEMHASIDEGGSLGSLSQPAKGRIKNRTGQYEDLNSWVGSATGPWADYNKNDNKSAPQQTLEPEAPKPTVAPPSPTSYNVDVPGVLKQIRKAKNVPSIISDDYIKGQLTNKLSTDVPGAKLEDNILTATPSQVEMIQSGFKNQLGNDMSRFIKPIDSAPKVVPVPIQVNDPALQKAKQERDKAKKELNRLKKKQKSDKEDDAKESDASEEKPARDETRSDRALFHINPELHDDRYAR